MTPADILIPVTPQEEEVLLEKKRAALEKARAARAKKRAKEKAQQKRELRKAIKIEEKRCNELLQDYLDIKDYTTDEAVLAQNRVLNSRARIRRLSDAAV